MTGDEQILLQEVTRFLVVVSPSEGQSIVFKRVVEDLTSSHSDFVYTFLGHFPSALKRRPATASLLGPYLSEKALAAMVPLDEKHCKVTEMLLKITNTVLKQPTPSSPEDFKRQQTALAVTLQELRTRFKSNPAILSHVIKLLALTVLSFYGLSGHGLMPGKDNDAFFLEVACLLAKYSPMKHKEQVRIAVSKALAKLLPLLVSTAQAPGPRFGAQLYLLKALVLLLNDEQPDIRFYLCESPALAKVVDHEGKQPWKLLDDGFTVRLND